MILAAASFLWDFYELQPVFVLRFGCGEKTG